MYFVHFADDVIFFASNSDIDNVHASVNRVLVGVITGSRPTDLFSLNISKTSYMIISNRKNALNIKIRKTILTKISTVKFLCVIYTR